MIDSLINLYQLAYKGVGQLQSRQSKFSIIMRKIKQIAWEHGCSIVYTNVVVDQVDGYGNSKKILGGHILGHASYCRLKLSKEYGFHAHMEKNPCQAEKICKFAINAKGITDAQQTHTVHK